MSVWGRHKERAACMYHVGGSSQMGYEGDCSMLTWGRGLWATGGGAGG